jgi:glycosyltransferase involved in cell wall biosynthesis
MYKSERVNVIMPVYNEEKTISEIIKKVLEQKIVDRLIIVDDGSKDGSLERIKQAAKNDRRITYFINERNSGKGFSVRRGLAAVKEGIVIIQDADLEYYPDDYIKLVSKVKDDTAVFGTRIRKRSGHGYRMAKIANDVLTSTFDVLYGRDLTDINTCYKVFKRKMIRDSELDKNDFLLDPQILVTLVKKGYKIVEVDIKYKGRSYEEGKRINAMDGIKQGLFLIKSRFTD